MATEVAGPRRAAFDIPEEGLPPIEEPDDIAVSRETPKFPKPENTRIFVVANQKGGVGKTTTTVNIATAMAMAGLNVLVCDLDAQGNASTALGIDHASGTPGTYEVMIAGDEIAQHVQQSPESRNLRVLPATIDLASAEIQLVNIVARERRLEKALSAYLAENDCDYVFIDCPPSLGLITLNALVAAREILVPIQCEYYALEGVSQLVNTINLVKGELNDDLVLSTILLKMFDGRTKLAAQVAAEVRNYFPNETLDTVIPRSVRVSEAPSFGQTVLSYQPQSTGAQAYLEAAQEIALQATNDDDEENI
ncbi:MAG: ParA family protein [Propionibacteriaceae bacterium]